MRALVSDGARRLLPFFLTEEGGEGRGEEALNKIPLSPALSPLVPRGERVTRFLPSQKELPLFLGDRHL